MVRVDHRPHQDGRLRQAAQNRLAASARRGQARTASKSTSSTRMPRECCGSPPRPACCGSIRKPKASTSYTTREGLPDNVVQCILPDQAGNLWLSTNNGISRFNPRENSFSNYHESDGLQGEQFNRKSCFVDPAGIMYFGGLHGFNMFDPSRIPAARRGAVPGHADRIPDSRKRGPGPAGIRAAEARVANGLS